MNFDERNAAWTGLRREFRQVHSRSNTPRVWVVWVHKNIIGYRWGQLGGAMQEANEVSQGVNIGKKNEMSPEAYALDRAKEMCRKKHWEGYREVMVNEVGEEIFLDQIVEKKIDFDSLPLSLCFYKPDNSMGAGITKKAEQGKVYYARKANGMMFAIAKGTGPAKLYSRRMLRYQDDEDGQDGKSWDTRFSTIQASADRIMPPNSILLGELTVIDSAGNEDFKAIQSLTKSLTDEALSKLEQLRQQGKKPAFYCWDIAFWDGQDLVAQSPVSFRYDLIHEVIEGPGLIPVEFYSNSSISNPASAVDLAKRMGWEGFVVIDPDGVYGDRAYNFKGKPDRPGAFCAKLKPAYEDDFVALWDPEKGWGERSTKGRYGGGIKSVSLWQYDKNGSLTYISNVNSGLTEEMKRDLANPAAWPQVWKVEYTERTYQSQGDDTNALTFARYIETRSDKKPEECINHEL